MRAGASEESVTNHLRANVGPAPCGNDSAAVAGGTPSPETARPTCELRTARLFQRRKDRTLRRRGEHALLREENLSQQALIVPHAPKSRQSGRVGRSNALARTRFTVANPADCPHPEAVFSRSR